MSIRSRIIISIVCFILGVPAITSFGSYVWHSFKFGMQEVNCAEDLSAGIIGLDFDNGRSASDDIVLLQNQLKDCVKNLDFNKGNIDFILEQRRRYLKE